jgi:hypothetical protein
MMKKMELNSIRNVMETVVKSNLSDKIGFHNWVIAKSYSHVGRNKKIGVKLEMNFSVPLNQTGNPATNLFPKPNSISSFVTILKAVMTKNYYIGE